MNGQVSVSDEVRFDLQAFLPYRIRVFYTDVTSTLSEIYIRDHRLTPSEWRSMAILGATGRMPATEIVERSSMDKVSVSRAVKKMHERGLLEKTNNAEDGRSSLLSLSEKGRAIYFDLVPKMLAAEARMFDGVSDEEVSAFISTMAKVRKNLQNA
jgi:DNA-binding MarR family transcriptional regulator